MADHQAIVQGIRSFLASRNRSFHEDLPDLAAGYASLCRDANARLRRCLEFVRRGALSEAAHLAGCQPELDRLVAELRFAEWDEWVETCATHGLQRPVSLIDGLDGIRTAIATEAKIAPLLGRHRLLAISRAPIPERLSLVRLLRKHDPDNPAWVEEARRLEPSMLSALATRYRSAVAAGEAKVVERILTEVDSAEWHAELPDDLASAVEAARRQAQDLQTNAELQTLSARFLKPDAFRGAADLDIEATISRWEDLRGESSSRLSEDLESRVDQVIQDWRTRQAARRSDEEEEAAHHLFKRQVDGPVDDGAPGRWRRIGQFVLIAIVIMMVVAIGYFLVDPGAWHEIRGFLPTF